MSLFSAAAATFNTTTNSIKETTTSCCLSLYTKISPSASTSKFIAKKTTTTTTVLVVSKSSSGDDVSSISRGTGTTTRGRRLLKVREEKRKREFDRLHNYPSWAKVLENAAKNDVELRNVLGDTIGNPDQMRLKIGYARRGETFTNPKQDPLLLLKSPFETSVGSNIWFKLYGPPSDRDVDLIGTVIQSWYLMGRLGAYNSSNLQLANTSMEYNPLYDADKGFNVMPSSFHDIGC
ncbi:structural maintenance of chromosomes-like protein [Tanacetum coccineum]